MPLKATHVALAVPITPSDATTNAAADPAAKPDATALRRGLLACLYVIIRVLSHVREMLIDRWTVSLRREQWTKSAKLRLSEFCVEGHRP
jgi:hypothetical protein